MAGDGYDINVDVDFDDEKARAELRQFMNYLKRNMAMAAKLADIDIDIDTLKAQSKTSKFIAQTNTRMSRLKKGQLDVEIKEQKLASEESKLQGWLAKARSFELRADINQVRLAAEIEKTRHLASRNAKVEMRADVDLKMAEAKLAAFRAKEAAKPITKNVNVNTGAAVGQLLSFSRGVEQTVSRLGSMALLAGGAGAALGAVGTGIGVFGLATAASMDQAMWAFQNLMGSAQAAAPIMEQLKRSAMNTPFDLNDVISLAFRLKSAGRSVQGLAGDAETLADALAATGGGAQQLEAALFQIQQLQGRSKILEREDLRTLNNQLPGFMGTFTTLFGDKREFGSPEKAMDAVFETIAAIPGAAGAAARATEETFMGRFNKFKDTIQINFAEAFMPRKDVLFAGLDSVSDAINDFLVGFAPVGAETLGKLGPIIADLIRAATPMIVLFTEAFPKMLSNFVPVVEKVSDAFVRWGISADGLADIITKLVVGGVILKFAAMLLGIVTPILTFVTSLSQLGASLGGLAPVWSKFTSAFATLTGPVGWVVALLGLIIPAILKSKDLMGQLSSAFKFLGGVGRYLGTALMDLFKSFEGLGKPLADILVPAFAGLVLVIGGVVAAVGMFIQALALVVRVIAPIVGFVVKLVVALTPLGYILGFLSGQLRETGAEGHGFIKFLEDFGDTATRVGDTITNFLNNTIGKLSDALSNVPVIGNLFKREEVKVAESAPKIAKNVDGITESLQGATQEAQLFATNFRNFLSADLPEMHVIDFNAKDTEQEFAKVQKSFEKQLAEMQRRSKNVSVLIEKGYGDIADHALSIGGEAGAGLIDGFAKELEEGSTKTVEAFRETLKKLKVEQEKWRLLEIRMQDEIASTAVRELFTTDPVAVKDLQTVLADIRKTGSMKLFDNLLDIYEIEKGTVAFKELKKMVDEAAKEHYSIELGLNPKTAASVIAKELSKIPATKAVELLADLSPGKLETVLELIPGELLMGLVPSMDRDLLEVVLSAVPTELHSSILAAIDDPLLREEMEKLAAELDKHKKLVVSPSIDKVSLDNATESVRIALGNIRPNSIPLTVSIPAIKYLQQGNSLNPQISSTKHMQGSSIKVGSSPRLQGGGARLQGNATGSQFYPGGWGLVGEHGPELVQLPRGSKIFPAISSERMMSTTNNNGGDTYNTTINGIGFEDASAKFEERVRNRNRRFI